MGAHRGHPRTVHAQRRGSRDPPSGGALCDPPQRDQDPGGRTGDGAHQAAGGKGPARRGPPRPRERVHTRAAPHPQARPRLQSPHRQPATVRERRHCADPLRPGAPVGDHPRMPGANASRPAGRQEVDGRSGFGSVDIRRGPRPPPTCATGTAPCRAGRARCGGLHRGAVRAGGGLWGAAPRQVLPAHRLGERRQRRGVGVHADRGDQPRSHRAGRARAAPRAAGSRCCGAWPPTDRRFTALCGSCRRRWCCSPPPG